MLTWLSGSATKPPILLKLRSSKTFIILTVASAVFTDIFAYGIVVPVLPFALTTRVGIDPSQIQTWISIFLAIYGASLLVSAPFFGYLADRMSGRQFPFLVGLVLLGGSTAMLCVGNSIALFAAGRVLQGASGAVVWVVGLALLVDTVGPEEIGAAMGYVGLSMSLAILLAPLLGGVVFARAGYYSVFAMAFGLIVLDVLLRVAMIERKTAKKWLDAQEQSGTGEGESSSAEEKIEAEPGTRHRTPTDDNAAENSATLNKTSKDEAQDPPVERHISRSSNPLEGATPSHTPSLLHRLPPVITLFTSRRIVSALWACIIQSSLLTAFDSILPLFVKTTFAWNSTGAGLIFLPIVLATFLGPIVGSLSDRYGARWFATAGFVIACPFLILLRLVDHNSLDQKVLLCALLALVGVGLTLALTPIMAEIGYAVDAKAKRHPPGFFGANGAYAQAYGLFNMAWAAGAMIGPLLGGLITESDGWPTATLILGCVSVGTAVPTAVWTGGSIFKKRRVEREGRDSDEA